MKAVSQDTELEGKEMRDWFDIHLCSYLQSLNCDVVLDYIQNPHPNEIEEIEGKLSTQGTLENSMNL